MQPLHPLQPLQQEQQEHHADYVLLPAQTLPAQTLPALLVLVPKNLLVQLRYLPAQMGEQAQRQLERRLPGKNYRLRDCGNRLRWQCLLDCAR